MTAPTPPTAATPATSAPATPPGRDRTLIAILAVIGVIVVIALIVVFTRGEPQRLDESTPEGVVQQYAEAVIAGDTDAALGYLTPEVAETCDIMTFAWSQDTRVTHESTTEREGTADVRVTITVTYDNGLFGTSSYDEAGVFRLVDVDGAWLIESAPWQFEICAESVS